MGKKKWTGPNERKRQHRFNKNEAGGRGRGRRFGDKSRTDAKPSYQPKGERNHRDAKPDFRQENIQPRVGLTEKDVGITEYVGKSAGFTGIIKAR